MVVQQPIEIDYLAVGLTKSAMFLGVTIRLFFTNLVVCTLICIDAHTVAGIPLCIFLHLLFVKLSIREPHFYSIYFKAFFMTPLVLNSQFWGGTNSYEPW
jgi:type IV secretory pathway VirB3-like protein